MNNIPLCVCALLAGCAAGSAFQVLLDI